MHNDAKNIMVSADVDIDARAARNDGPPLPRFLTVDEVADMTRLARATVYKLAASGEIPSQKMRRRLLFPAREIEAWIANEGKPLPPTGRG
jgi:putative molybdopterin biosynthesis protein